MQQSSVLPTRSEDGQARSSARRWLGQLAGLGLLAATVHFVEPRALLARLSQLHVSFVVVGAALVVPQLHCLALRWRLTAAQLGQPFAQRHALREYGLSMLLNLLLPFGIAGDAIRVLRHSNGTTSPQPSAASLQARAPQSDAREPHDLATSARAASSRSPQEHAGEPLGLARAFHSVVLERMMGQVVVIVWAVATLPLWFGRTGLWLSAAALAAMLLCAVVVRHAPHPQAARSTPMRALLQLSQALQQLLASPRYLSAQFALSSVITLSIAAQLYCALGALGLSLSAAQATQVFPLMLLSMSLPLAFAGFGPREAVTAELYDILHLSAADGAAFALAFGAILIITALPCLLLVLYLAEEPAS